ncbi:glycosyltransferase family 4 protein [Halothiobacillus sp. DCM-1]|uniref:glycosyltransferase family 4 protein n=1 Tax=Halothiobacillus sp. DCM-1 TaxID=3112558 RepID=UPI00324CE6AF
MLISLVTETYAPDINGVATTLAQLHGALVAAGHQVEVICPRGRSPRENLRALEVPGVPLPFYPEVRLGLPVRRRLRQRWQSMRPDLVHIATEGPLGFAALREAERLGLPVTSSLHTNFHTYTRDYRVGWLSQPVMRYLRWFHNRTALTFIPTAQQSAELSALDFARLVVLGRGVDTQLFSPTRRDESLRRQWQGSTAPDNPPIALHVGRLAPEKNLDLLIESFAALRREQPTLTAVVVGDGPERNRLAKALPWAHFVGMQRGEALARHYASADLFIFPSVSETFGNVVLEAMASGLPVVSFDYAAGNQLIRHGENGYLIPLQDQAAFIATACEAARSRSPAMGQRARDTALQHDWGHITQAFEHHLQRVATAALIEINETYRPSAVSDGQGGHP